MLRARWCLSVPALRENIAARRPSYTTKNEGKSAMNSAVSLPWAISWYDANLPYFPSMSTLSFLLEVSKRNKVWVLF